MKRYFIAMLFVAGMAISAIAQNCPGGNCLALPSRPVQRIVQSAPVQRVLQWEPVERVVEWQPVQRAVAVPVYRVQMIRSYRPVRRLLFRKCW